MSDPVDPVVPEDPKDPKDPKPNDGGGDNPQPSDKVPSGLLREAKEKRRAAESERDKLQKQIDDAKSKKLEEEGKHVELIAELKTKNSELEKKFQDTILDFAIDKALQGEVNISKAEDRADHVDALSKHVDRTQINISDGNVDNVREQISSQIDKMKQRSALKGLFGTANSEDDNLEDPPANPDSTTTGAKPSNKVLKKVNQMGSYELSKLSRKELNELAVGMGRKPNA